MENQIPKRKFWSLREVVYGNCPPLSFREWELGVSKVNYWRHYRAPMIHNNSK